MILKLNLNDLILKKQDEYKKSEVAQNQLGRNIFKVEYDFTLNVEEKVFSLVIDSEFPIEMMVLHCAKSDLSIVEVKTKDIILNIIEDSIMDKETLSHTKFMATLKPKGATHRIEIILRTYEGPKDNLKLTIIPNNKPNARPKPLKLLDSVTFSVSFKSISSYLIPNNIKQVIKSKFL